MASNQRGHADGFNGVNEFVVVVHLHIGRYTLALGTQDYASISGDFVGIGAQAEKICCGFHRCETAAWNLDGGRARKALDGSSHGDFELDHCCGIFIARVHRFAIHNHRQGQDAIRFF